MAAQSKANEGPKRVGWDMSPMKASGAAGGRGTSRPRPALTHRWGKHFQALP